MKYLRLALALFIASACDAHAQSTAQPVLPGSLTTSGCPSGYTSCYIPYTNSNPLPTTVVGGSGGTVTANQGTPAALSSTPVAGTVTTHLTFQSALAASPTRKGCTIQNTSTDTLYIEPIATGSATTAASFQVTPFGTFSCVQPSGVLTDNIAITSKTTDSATYVVNSQ